MLCWVISAYLLPHQPIGLALVQFDSAVGLRFSNGPGKKFCNMLGLICELFFFFYIGNTFAFFFFFGQPTFAHKCIFINASRRRTSKILLKIQVLHEKNDFKFFCKTLAILTFSYFKSTLKRFV